MSANADLFHLSGGKGPHTRADFYENNIGKAKVCAERLFKRYLLLLEKRAVIIGNLRKGAMRQNS